jgi:hypothetical protein
MTALLAGRDSVPIAKLLPNGKTESVTSVIREVARRAQANLEEKGLETLFVALGMATWTADDGGRPAEAPVLLLPVTLETKGSSFFHISRGGSVQFNLVLQHVLETQFGVAVDPENLAPDLFNNHEGEAFDPSEFFDALSSHASQIPGFEVKAAAILGNFAFQKMAMVKDLQQRADELAAHDIVAAIAGDTEARVAVSAAQQDLDPKGLDLIPPENEFIVLDADSSQQCAIGSVAIGQNAVIHGPPGTGKSQTIANLVATLAATGSRVLFVAEKRAALDVVLRRLKDAGLGHLAIDLHGADLSPKRVMQQVAETLDTVRNAVPADCEQVHEQLVDRRTRLNAHVDRLHTRREPTNTSVYEMHGNLLRLTHQALTRWRGEELLRLKPDVAVRVRNLLTEAAGFESLFLRNDPSPWTGANLPDGIAVQNAIALVVRASTDAFPAFLRSLASVLQTSALRRPSSLRDCFELMDLVAAVQHTLGIYAREIYEQDHAALLQALQPGTPGGLAGVWAWLTDSEYRKARSSLRSLRNGGVVPVPVLAAELEEIQRQTARWRQLSDTGSLPCTVPEFWTHKKNSDALFSDISSLEAILAGKNIPGLPLDEVGTLLSALVLDTSTPHQIPKLTQIEKALDKAGVSQLVAEIREKKFASTLWIGLFQYAWLASTLDALSLSDPEIRGFRGATQNRYVEDFFQLDEERIAIAAERVRRAHGLRAIEAMNAHPDQQHIIKAEAAKMRRHLPLRKVFTQASEVLTAVCPCWMASPLSVSQLLDGGKQYFDFVIFDEASQVLPEDAIPAILRGRKVVVAGDNKQLPPTTFFAAGDDDEYAADEEAGASEGFESLLDMMIPFVKSCYLDWHYRSRDEALIRFSNHYIYQERLVTFPGPGGPPAVQHELVAQEGGVDGKEESSDAEARRVIDLVIDHARHRPTETLGVITMGIKHMYRVQAALDRELEKHPDLAPYFDPSVQERFFVKNLERVQGDERDAIIVSVGYAKDRAGNLPLRFGPLLGEGGRRRLNVAITRARQRLMLVSSFSYTDIDLARIRPGSGVELLRDYLQYAASQGKRLGDGRLTTIPLNDFEADIFDTFTAEGLKLIPQFGASQFRIDMVAEHPTKSGRLVLAIECDGATYHSSYTARDRDRLRQQQLERLGWRFHRIWSTDWFMRKSDEVERAMQTFQSAVQYADRLDSGLLQNGGRTSTQENKVRPNGSAGNETGQQRGPRPSVALKPSIELYSHGELVELIEWISSDGKLRTDAEIMREMVTELGFSRRGIRIEAAVDGALKGYRAMKSETALTPGTRVSGDSGKTRLAVPCR